MATILEDYIAKHPGSAQRYAEASQLFVGRRRRQRAKSSQRANRREELRDVPLCGAADLNTCATLPFLVASLQGKVDAAKVAA